MLKVEPRFKLDRSYRGPYRVQGVTPTNVFIRPVNDPNGEKFGMCQFNECLNAVKCHQLFHGWVTLISSVVAVGLRSHHALILWKVQVSQQVIRCLLQTVKFQCLHKLRRHGVDGRFDSRFDSLQDS